MNKMKGALFLLQCEIASVYTTVAAMRTTSMTVNSELVEVTDKEILFRELLENAGISSTSIKASGVVSDSSTYDFIRGQALTGAISNCKLVSQNGEVFTGAFAFTSFESSGEYNKEEVFNLTLESANQTLANDNNFILLEDGGFLLLEDGFKFILEAA